jgi:hypothetical protein
VSGAGHERRILRELGVPDAIDRLARLKAPDLRTLLLAVARRRVAALGARDVLRQHSETPTLRPARHDAGALRALETAAIARLPDGFQELVLAPEAAFGTSALFGGSSQDRMVTTTMGTELVSDATNVLALECARCRLDPQDRRQAATKLAAVHRVLRPRTGAHFGLIALVTADRDRGSFAAQTDALREHLRWHLTVVLDVLPPETLTVRLTDLTEGLRRDVLEHDVRAHLEAEHPGVTFVADPDRQAARGYYAEACFAVDAGDANVCDGGFTTWTADLLADRKERLLISGLGTDRLLDLSAR